MIHPASNEQIDLLVQQARSGDRQAFGELVRLFQDAVFRVVRRTSRVGREQAEDLAQETFLRAYRALDRFRGECSFAHWLFRIATNVTINRVSTVAARAEKKAVSIDARRADDDKETRVEPVDVRQPAPALRLEREELRKVLGRALKKIPDDFRAAVVLRDVEGLEYEAIAEVLEVPVGTVRSRLHRGREALREIITRMYGTPVLDTAGDGGLG